MRVKGVKVLAGKLVGEVVFGYSKVGSQVSTLVQLDRTDEAVQEALKPLEALLRTRALENVNEAISRRAAS